MKNLYLLFLAIMCISMNAQNKNETVNYINDKLIEDGTIAGKGWTNQIRAEEDYLYLSFKERPEVYERFKLYEVNIEFMYANSSEEIGKYKVAFVCHNEEKCMFSKMSKPSENFKYYASSLYFDSLDSARRVTTAFKHLKSLMKQKDKKELFGY